MGTNLNKKNEKRKNIHRIIVGTRYKKERGDGRTWKIGSLPPKYCALCGKRRTIKGGRNRGRRPRNVEQNRCNESARDTADVECNQRGEPLHGGHRVGDRQKHNHGKGRRKSRHRAEDDADEHADHDKQDGKGIGEDTHCPLNEQ